ncbi:MAG TPA: 3-oxoacyl-[acyl-carrier-protein] synthase III C-terminal domain-containing protein [Myxococcota bacterium]
MPNSYWLEHHPELVGDVTKHSLSKVFKEPEGGACLFDVCMKPYLNDPFRGVVDRRWLSPGESLIDLEVSALRQACDAVGITPRDLDLVIVGSLPRSNYEAGDAAFLAARLNLKVAYDLESACAQATVAVQNACALIETGRYERIAVVSACGYSQLTKIDDPLGWASGDGATAIIVGRVGADRGYLTGHTISSWETNCAITFHPRVEDGHEQPVLRMQANRTNATKLRDTAEPFITTCIGETLKKAGVTVDDVDYFVCNTPLAWYADFCAKAMGFSADKITNTHPHFANTGPVLMPTNLLFASHAGKLKDDALVCFYGVGSTATASAALFRWQQPALGALPTL